MANSTGATAVKIFKFSGVAMESYSLRLQVTKVNRNTRIFSEPKAMFFRDRQIFNNFFSHMNSQRQTARLKEFSKKVFFPKGDTRITNRFYIINHQKYQPQMRLQAQNAEFTGQVSSPGCQNWEFGNLRLF